MHSSGGSSSHLKGRSHATSPAYWICRSRKVLALKLLAHYDKRNGGCPSLFGLVVLWERGDFAPSPPFATAARDSPFTPPSKWEKTAQIWTGRPSSEKPSTAQSDRIRCDS